LLIRKDTRGKEYKEYADIKTDPPEEGIVLLLGLLPKGVDLPLGGRYLKTATPLVSVGDEVPYEQKIGEPRGEGFSLGVWASVGGTVTSIERSIVSIAGGAVPMEDAEAEAEAEAKRQKAVAKAPVWG
jgi:Na+-translocating ferredoxin:NAD+ oxidoreductase RnfC subunit